MKKVLFAFAMAAVLLAGCAKEYDDTDLRNRVTTLETKVGNLEAQIKAVQAVALGQYVQKVEKTDEGVTVTYGDGTVVTLKISAGGGAATGVLGITQKNNKLYYTLDGEIIKVDGKDLEVSLVSNIYVKDGKLYAVISGVETELGGFSGGASLQDGIFTNIEVTADYVVLTLSDSSKINIPIGSAFKLVIAKTQYQVTTTDPFDVPYTVNAKTANTEVDIFTDSNFSATVEADKFVITPKVVAEGTALAYADSKVGLTSIVKLTFGAEAEEDYAEVTDEPADPTQGIDYIGEGADGTVDAHIVSNVSLDKNSIKPQVNWISVVDVKANTYTITLALEDNTTGEIRTGEVWIYEAGTEKKLQTIVIAQKVKEEEPAEPDQELYGKVFEITPELSENYLFDAKELTNSTIEWRFYARSWHPTTDGQPNRLGAIESKGEQGIMLRFNNGGNAGRGQLHLSAKAMLGYEPQVTKEGASEPYCFEAEKWHTLTIVCDGTNMSIYDNGEYINKYALTNPTLNFERLEWGMSWEYNYNNDEYSLWQLFDGYIDYVRVWEVARSASEIKAGLCDVANNSEGLVAYWRFQKDSDFDGSYLVNRTGNADYDINWAEMSEMDGSTVRKTLDFSEQIKAAVKEYDGNLCAGTAVAAE